MRLQLILEIGAEDTTLDQRGTRGGVHLEDTVQVTQVDAHCSAVVLSHIGLDTPYDRGAAAERDGRDMPVGAPAEKVVNVLLGARVGDHVGRMAIIAADAADQVFIGFPECVDGALPGILCTQRLQRRRRAESGLGQAERAQSRRGSDGARLNAETEMHLAAQVFDLGFRETIAFVAPTPELSRALRFGEGHVTPRPSGAPACRGMR